MLNPSSPPKSFKLIEAYARDFQGASAFGWYVEYVADGKPGAEVMTGNWNPHQLSTLNPQRSRAIRSKKTSTNQPDFFVDHWVLYVTLIKGADKTEDMTPVRAMTSNTARRVAAALQMDNHLGDDA